MMKKKRKITLAQVQRSLKNNKLSGKVAQK